MIAEADIQKFFKYLASAFFLLFSLFGTSQDNSHKQYSSSSYVDYQGISSSRSDYYLNLMVQDIALPQQVQVEEVTFRIEYSLKYHLSKSLNGSYELTVLPISVKCSPMDYFGFDISSIIKPDIAGIAFQVRNQYGFLEDSLYLTDVPVGQDSTLYVTRVFHADFTNPVVEFTHLNFSFGEKTYETFRSRLNILDDYYAAIAILDSALLWSERYFPAGMGSIWGNYLQQLELRRIMDYIENSSFNEMIALAGNDPARYRIAIEKVRRKRLRVQTILERQVSEELDGINTKPANYWINVYFDWLHGYYSLASKSEHRFGNYYKGLADFRLTNGMVVQQMELVKHILTSARHGEYISQRLYLIGGLFSNQYVREAEINKLNGDVVSAIDNYGNALAIKRLVPGLGNGALLVENISLLNENLALSYLGLSKTAARKGNLMMSERYLSEAMTIIQKEGAPVGPVSLSNDEKEIYASLYQYAEKLLDQRNYTQALDIISYLQQKCSMGRYDCSGDVKILVKEVNQRLYLQKLDKAVAMMRADEYTECREYMEEAERIRFASTGTIERDKKEINVKSWLHQLDYDEDIREGNRFLNYGEYNIALFYLNRARGIEGNGYYLKRKDPNLMENLQKAAKPVIREQLETGKARARGYYFDEGWDIYQSCYRQMEKYDLLAEKELTGCLHDLDSLLRLFQCEKFDKDYHSLLKKAESRKEDGKYARALQDVNEAITMVLDDTVCDLNDQSAWYLRAALEYPVEYEQRLNEALQLIHYDSEGFIKAYLALGQYYDSRGLAAQGVTHLTLYERVLLERDPGFLEDMLLYFSRQKDKTRSVGVMNRNWELNQRAPSSAQQKLMADWIALDDYFSGRCEPLSCLNNYLPDHNAFKPFRNQYKYAWVKASKWKFRYLSLFLKNKSSKD